MTEDYLNGKVRTTVFTHETGRLTISRSEGGYTGCETHTITVVIHSQTPVTSVTVNGETAKIETWSRSSGAYPLSDNGGMPDGDVYAVTFTLPTAESAEILYN